MRIRIHGAAAVLVASFALAACGSDSTNPSSAASTPAPTTTSAASTPATSPASSPESSSDATSEAAPASTSSSAAPRGPQQCTRQRSYKIKITLGDIDCETAYGIAFRVDPDGDKRQTVEGYVCEYGNASIRPTIFSCTNRAQGAEFAVDEES